jgi:hypothetical protein
MSSEVETSRCTALGYATGFLDFAAAFAKAPAAKSLRLE